MHRHVRYHWCCFPNVRLGKNVKIAIRFNNCRRRGNRYFSIVSWKYMYGDCSDHAWGSNAVIAPQIKVSTPKTISDEDISDAAQKLLGQNILRCFWVPCASKDALHHAGRIATKSMHGSYVKRFRKTAERRGVVPIERLLLCRICSRVPQGLTHITFIGAPLRLPFAYPDKPGWLARRCRSS